MLVAGCEMWSNLIKTAIIKIQKLFLKICTLEVDRWHICDQANVINNRLGEEGWALKNWCFWTVVLEKTLESPLDCKEIQPVHSEGDQPWDFFGKNDAKTETPVLWPPHAKSWLIGKDSDAGMDWGQEEKGTTEDEMAGWHHWLDGRESEWTPGVGDGQGGLACCDSWGCKESDMTERLNWTELIVVICMLTVFFLLCCILKFFQMKC